MNAIHLDSANFCACCENIVEQGSGSLCPMCGSQAIRPLSAFLNREPPKPWTFPENRIPPEPTLDDLPRTIPELSHFIQVATPEKIRELLGVRND